MFTNTHTKFEVESLASSSAIKSQSVLNNKYKDISQLITIGNCNKISEALASMCETSQHYFKTDSATLSFSYKSALLARFMEHHV